MRRWTPFAIVVVLSLVIVACARGDDEAEPGTRQLPGEIVLAGRLVPFDACDELLDHLHGEALERVGAWGLEGGGYTTLADGDDAFESTGEALADAPAAADEGAAEGRAVAGEDFSTTNVQEAGIDEPDLVKTDGETIFAISGNRLHAVTTGDDPRVADSLDLDGYASDLLLVGDRLVVMGEGSGPLASDAANDRAMSIAPGALSLTLVDVSDPTELAVLETLAVEGHAVSARTIDGRVHVVVSSQAESLEFTYPEASSLPEFPGDEFFETSEREAEAANRDIVRRSTLDEWLPSFQLEADGEVVTSGRLTDCESVHQPPEFSGFGSLTVLSLDPAEGLAPAESTAVLSAGEIVYASSERLYVATNQWFEPVALAEQDTSIEFEDRTRIHAFDLTGSGPAEYVASGEVRGQLLSQFAMSEHDGFLRVASTEQSFGAVDFDDVVAEDTSESFVTVLGEQDGALVEVGRVGGLGRGEQIHSVRFLGDVGYVVTFRQTDPLYTVDLSDPSDPRVLGELKILGYSAYLHPIDDGLLIGVGQDATEEGMRLGTQVSLFDVSDLSAPERIDQLSLGAGESSIEFDHHAFLYWEGLTVVPVQRYDQGYSASAIALDIDRADGIVERAELVHPTSRTTVDESEEPPSIAPSPPPFDPTPAIQRSLVVEDTLFTFSDAGLLASDLDTLAEEAWIPLS